MDKRKRGLIQFAGGYKHTMQLQHFFPPCGWDRDRKTVRRNLAPATTPDICMLHVRAAGMCQVIRIWCVRYLHPSSIPRKSTAPCRLCALPALRTRDEEVCHGVWGVQQDLSLAY